MRGSGWPIAVNTRLGWVLSGPAELAGLNSVNLLFTHALRIDSIEEKIDATLIAFWELESELKMKLTQYRISSLRTSK